MRKISIIIPCYNEEETINIVYNALIDVESKMNEEYSFEHIFVDDGSKDKTLSILKSLSNSDYKTKYISFSRNFGKESAILAGLKNSTGDFVVLMDADMQDPPSLLPEMIQKLDNSDYDSVATKRSTRKGEPKLRSFFARKFYKIMNKYSCAEVTDGARDYRLMKRKMVDAILSMSEHDRFTKGIFGWVGFKTYWISYPNIERVKGTTKWSFFKLFKYAIKGITDFSYAPLFISFAFCFISFLASLGCFIADICIRCLNNYWNLFLSISTLVLFLNCLIMGVLGIMSIYISKINLEVKNRPDYIIGDTNINLAK